MNYIEKSLKEVIKETVNNIFNYQIDDNILMIEIPKDEKNGDYSSNIAMRLTKELKQKPQDIANSLKIEMLKSEIIEDVVVAGPGFINFYLNKSYIANVVNNVLAANENYGKSKRGNNEKILFEYVSVNPTGKLHIGHARGAAWGDACTRLLKATGHDVLREYYINDAGNQMVNLGLSIFARYKELFGQEFQLGDDGYHGQDIIEIAQIIKDEYQDKWLNETEGREQFFIDEGLKLELAQIKKDLEYYRVGFDSWISERSLYEQNLVEDVIVKLKASGYTYEQDGALWFKSTEFGDDKDRVLVKNDKTLTYLTPDIANHLYKFERGYTKLVDLFGADHHGYIPRMKAAIQALGYDKDQLAVDIIQMVRIVEGKEEVKMSKRTGNAITVRELCDDIGVDAARYFILQRALDTHLDFDLQLARSKSNENPVYYAQYAHARICSILNQAKEFEKQDEYKLLVEPQAISLLKYINEFEDVVYDAAINRAPNKVCNYIQKLAGYLHSFYANCKINDPTNPELTNERLGLLYATKITLKNAFDLIGIEAPEKM